MTLSTLDPQRARRIPESSGSERSPGTSLSWPEKAEPQAWPGRIGRGGAGARRVPIAGPEPKESGWEPPAHAVPRGGVKRRREETRVHCRVRLALCPSLSSNGPPCVCTTGFCPAGTRPPPRRLTQVPRIPESAFPRCSSDWVGWKTRARASPRRRRSALQGQASPILLGPITCAIDCFSGLGAGGRACSRVFVESGECIRLGSLMQPTAGRLHGAGEGGRSRVGTAFGPADTWSMSLPF